MRQEYRVGVGASSMLLIFVALLLTTLGVLALSSARNEAALAGRSLAMTQSYYEAAAAAQRELAELDAALARGEEIEPERLRLALDAGYGRTLDAEVEITADGRARFVRHTLLSSAEEGR